MSKIPNSFQELIQWLLSNKIDEVECLIPDMAGIARGKIIPCSKFIDGLKENSLKIPDGIFMQMVTGDYADDDTLYDSGDRIMSPVPSTIRIVPWYKNPTAQIICSVQKIEGTDVSASPRGVLKSILAEYSKLGLVPIVAPELELYFVDINTNPDLPLEPPVGLSKRKQINRQAYGIDAANEFDPIVDDIYDYAEKMRLDIDTYAHEMGAGQVEFNLIHGDPLALADQVFLFKRMARQAALRHGIYATFMAKPHRYESGSAMHIHISVYNKKNKQNIFSATNSKFSKEFEYFVSGLQRHVSSAMAIYAPNVNSYRRITHLAEGPINSHWAIDNRTVGFRIPQSASKNIRIENRLPGADCNPYLVIAVSLACGLLGLTEKLDATKMITGDAYNLKHTLPRHIIESISNLSSNKSLIALLSPEFVKCYCTLKKEEFNKYHQVISSWERENLLLNV